MAVSPVQQYFNMALSLTSSNKSKKDIDFSLPDNLRRYENLKISRFGAFRYNFPAGISIPVAPIGTLPGSTGDSVILIMASHPVSITHVNGAALGNPLRTSFFAIARDRATNYDPDTTVLTILNNLHSPNYNSTSGGSTSPVELLVFHASYET